MPSKDKAGRAFPAGRGDNAKPHQPPTTRITPHAFGFRPGIDLDKLGKLADELEDEIYAAEQRRP
jgi:hypothetical protein